MARPGRIATAGRRLPRIAERRHRVAAARGLGPVGVDVAQPTQETLPPWSPTFRHAPRRSFDTGIAALRAASGGLRGCGGCGEEVIFLRMADNDQYADLVFEGGGVKGIGLAGA